MAQAAATAPPLAWSRMGTRFAHLFAGTPAHERPGELAYFLQVARAAHPGEDLSSVTRAYLTAAEAHGDQRRHNGVPYITHPLAVATILARMGMPTPVLSAAMLHDTIEDTHYQLDQLRLDFGDEVAELVDAVTKIDKATAGNAAKAETVRKMVIAMAKDIRVLVMKLADRLHNARTYRHVPKESSRKAQARETLEIYVPLAHRLGMGNVKRELEDLCFATLHPHINREITRLVEQRAIDHDPYLAELIADLEHELDAAGVSATVTSRRKHLFSVYRTVLIRGRELSDFGDVSAVQVLTNSLRDCYLALGAIHTRWRPLPNRFKDFVASPKFNLYQSLHTTVLGPGGRPVAMQIRTTEMNEQAEDGISACWRHNNANPTQNPGELSWVLQLADWQAETRDSGEFLESLRLEMESDETFVFTPHGEILTLPSGATPVDFAYSVHTEIGHTAIGASVNGRLVPMESTLDNGDVVEIFTSKAEGAGPSRDWLKFVSSARARNKINQWFTKRQRAEVPTPGAAGGPSEWQHGGSGPSWGDAGSGQSRAAPPPAPTPRVPVPRRAPDIIVEGQERKPVRLAGCCTPVPGDSIVGIATSRNGLSVHRADCLNFAELREHHELVGVTWSSASDASYLAEIWVEAIDRVHLLSDITRVMSDRGVSIQSAQVSTDTDRVAAAAFTIEVSTSKQLTRVLGAVKNVTGVFDVRRVGDADAGDGVRQAQMLVTESTAELLHQDLAE